MNVSMKTFEYVALEFLIINLSTQWKTKSWSLCNWDKAAWGYCRVWGYSMHDITLPY